MCIYMCIYISDLMIYISLFYHLMIYIYVYIYVCIYIYISDLMICTQNFPHGPVVKNLPANAGDTGSVPDSGRFYLPGGN